MARMKPDAAARRYHERTKHTYASIRAGGGLDWANEPAKFKDYLHLEPLPLPAPDTLRRTGVPALEALVTTVRAAQRPSYADLAQLLYYAAGVTRTRRRADGELFHFRAAACAGALYPIEVYLVTGDLPDLPAGVYHFHPRDFALRRLREGDFRGHLAQATASEAAVTEAPAVLVLSAIFWRSAWKYRARSYRYCYWDAGMMLANLLAMAAALRLPTRIVLGFVDGAVNRLLALDGRREAALCLVPVGGGAGPVAAASAPPPEIAHQVAPLSAREVEYPEIVEMHAASCLATPQEVRRWRQALKPQGALRSAGSPLTSAAGEGAGSAAKQQRIPLPGLPGPALPSDSIERVILRRGSTRAFAREPMRMAELATILHRATRGLAADYSPGPDAEPAGHLNDLYLIVHAVQGLESGAYTYAPEAHELLLLRAGEFRSQAGYLCLEQALSADAATVLCFLADPGTLGLGDRGYRAAQLEAGIVGGRAYLAAYAQRLGATGQTFYDDDLVAFFAEQATGKDAIFVVATGVDARRPWRRD